MERIILYGSEYGTSEAYAKALSARTGIPAISYQDAGDMDHYDAVIYLGALYAGGVLGLSKTVKRIRDVSSKAIVIITVGLADPEDEENIANIRKNLERQLPQEVFSRAAVFHLRGGIDYSNLHLTHKTMMRLLYEKAKNLPEEKKNAEVRAMIATYGQRVSFVDLSRLDGIVKAILALDGFQKEEPNGFQ